jgi:pyridoxal phosphate enzyme (YggS family)
MTLPPATVPADEVIRLRQARDRVLERIATACARVGREAGSVELVAVSKTVDPERLRAAVAAGLTTLGENRVQEAAAKVPLVPGAARWHLVGPLQSNKARRAIELFDVIETVDSIELLRRLDRIAGERAGGSPYPVLLEVNVDGDPAKAGLSPEAVPSVLEAATDLGHVSVRGLMTIGRLVADASAARPTFAGLRRLSERLRVAHPTLGPELSMGMTDDFETAIEEGATLIRVGRALFGERPHVHGPAGVAHVHRPAGASHVHSPSDDAHDR